MTTFEPARFLAGFLNSSVEVIGHAYTNATRLAGMLPGGPNIDSGAPLIGRKFEFGNVAGKAIGVSVRHATSEATERSDRTDSPAGLGQASVWEEFKLQRVVLRDAMGAR